MKHAFGNRRKYQKDEAYQKLGCKFAPHCISVLQNWLISVDANYEGRLSCHAMDSYRATVSKYPSSLITHPWGGQQWSSNSCTLIPTFLTQHQLLTLAIIHLSPTFLWIWPPWFIPFTAWYQWGSWNERLPAHQSCSLPHHQEIYHGSSKWQSLCSARGRRSQFRPPVLTIHVDLLGQFYKLHFSRHVTHSPHTVPQVPAVDVAIFIFVKFLECFSQLCGGRSQWRKRSQHYWNCSKLDPTFPQLATWYRPTSVKVKLQLVGWAPVTI